MVEAAGAEPAGRTNCLDMVLVNGEATGAPDKRVARGAVPPTRPKMRTRSLKPEWRGSGLLTRRLVDRNHSRPPKHTTHRTSYRSGRTGRPLKPAASSSSQVRILPGPPFLRGDDCRCVYRRVCTPTGRGSALRAHSVAVRLGPDAPSCFALTRFAGSEPFEASAKKGAPIHAPLRLW